MNRNELTAGTKVLLGSKIVATVISVDRNGVKVGYWGRGLKEGQWVEERTSARYLSPFQMAA